MEPWRKTFSEHKQTFLLALWGPCEVSLLWWVCGRVFGSSRVEEVTRKTSIVQHQLCFESMDCNAACGGSRITAYECMVGCGFESGGGGIIVMRLVLLSGSYYCKSKGLHCLLCCPDERENLLKPKEWVWSTSPTMETEACSIPPWKKSVSMSDDFTCNAARVVAIETVLWW